MLTRKSVVVVFISFSCGTRPVTLTEDAGFDAGVLQTDAGSYGEDSGVVVDSGTPPVDLDLDGLDDAYEQRIASAYLPSLSLHPRDGCPLGVIIYRLRKHPLDPALLFIVYDHLYESDCGIGGHVGDNEAFGVTVNPSKPAPDGITAMKAISHQGTFCEKVTACGTCGSLTACDSGDGGRPRLYASRGKHGGYAQKSACTLVSICPDDCAAGEQLGVPVVNVGEPNAPLLRDLTDAGVITTDAGWSKSEVFGFDPWGPHNFGGAGSPAGDLIDPAFDTPACP